MKTLVTLIVASLLFGFTLIKDQTPEEKGLSISKKAEASDNGWGNYSSKSAMILKNRNGQTTTRQMHAYFLEVEGDGDKSMTVFDTPKDVKGTASMTYTHKIGDDDQWLYLPSIKRVKRISSSNKSGPFMGSEFAFEDLSSQEVEKFKHKYIGLVKLSGTVCYKIERYPVSKTSGYKRVVVYLNKANYRPERLIFYDRKNSKLKTLVYSNYKKFLDKYWRAQIMKMTNHQNGKQTILKFSEISFNLETITEESFTQNSLKRAK